MRMFFYLIIDGKACIINAYENGMPPGVPLQLSEAEVLFKASASEYYERLQKYVLRRLRRGI